jgi:hypothetical protein
MTTATASVAALLLCYVAAACLARAMRRYDRAEGSLAKRQTARAALRMRVGGVAALATALAICMVAWSPSIGLVAWIGFAGAGCLAWMGLSAFLPRTALWLAPMGAALLAVGLLLPL